jgi:hypothetical protein
MLTRPISGKHDKLLGQRGIANCILHKGKRNQPLSGQQKQQNRRWSGSAAPSGGSLAPSSNTTASARPGA